MTSSVMNDYRLMTEARTRQIYERIQAFRRGEGHLTVSITAAWQGELRWARNRVTAASDRRDVRVTIVRIGPLGSGRVTTNQTDDTALMAAVHAAERKVSFGDGVRQPQYDGLHWQPPRLPFPDTAIWSDATYDVTPRQRSVLAQTLTEEAEARQLLSAGFLQMRVHEQIVYGGSILGDENRTTFSYDDSRREGSGKDQKSRDTGYSQHTESQCSMTVRHPQGRGAGWAGRSSFDWKAIDAGAVAKRALEKCLASLNPVAIEPGRYTTIFEPQAMAQLVDDLVVQLQHRRSSEDVRSPDVFSLDIDPASGLRRTKMGMKVVDERISIMHDPMDPQFGILPGLGLQEVTWIEHGVLKSLGYDRGRAPGDYSLPALNANLPVLQRSSYAMTGGTTTMEEMIATTKRGVIVSRFSNITSVPGGRRSLLSTGLTRDGLWLVENGKISKPVKNMRFTDSPLFVLNQIVQLGMPAPVFKPTDDMLRPTIVPSLKSNDFAFTALADAV